jgi:NAD(P)-dependent dehydrogenase (short-subunit alcohol dehydrogenase family)
VRKNYLIIGGSSGIGAELVNRLAVKHQVIATYYRHPVESNDQVKYVEWDALNEDADFTFIPDVLHGLVYCPGSIQLKPMTAFREQDFIMDYRLNVIGALRILQKALPALKKSGSASVVLFSTVAVQTGMPFHSLVASSKGAIEGLTRSLGAEWAPNIRVNAIAPSLTDTPLAAGLLNVDTKRQAMAERHPLKRIGTAKEIAGIAEFLLSEDATWMSAQVIHTDGGMGNIKTN